MTKKRAASRVRTTALLAALGLFAAREGVARAQSSSPLSAPSNLGPAQKPRNGLGHFGHLVALPGETASTQLVREVEGHTNAVGFFFDPSRPAATAGAVAALSASMGGVVFVNDVFMNADGTSKSPAVVTMNLGILKANLGAKIAASAVPYLAFDEPMWRRQVGFCKVKGGGEPAVADCVWNGPRPEVVAEMRPKLEGWFAQLRGVVGSAPSITYIEAHAMIRDALEIPVNADVYGYDCYDDFDRCSRDRRSGTTYSNRQLWDGLKARIASFDSRWGGHRRMALIAPTTLLLSRGAIRNDAGISGSPQFALDRHLAAPTTRPDQASADLTKKHYDAFLRDPMTVLVGNFMWSTGEEGDAMWVGARGLPETRALLERTGRQVLGKPPAPAAGPPVVELKAQSGAVATRTGSIWVWTSSNATSCRSLSDAALPVMPPGGALYRAPDPAPTKLTYSIACTGPGGTTNASVTYASTASRVSTPTVDCGRGRAGCL